MKEMPRLKAAQTLLRTARISRYFFSQTADIKLIEHSLAASLPHNSLAEDTERKQKIDAVKRS